MSEVNDKIIKRGCVSINKKELNDFVATVYDVERKLDIVMSQKESFERGQKVAKLVNALTFARHAFQHFQLGVPLNKLK